MKVIIALITTYCSLALTVDPEELYQYYQRRNLELLNSLSRQNPLPLGLNFQTTNPLGIEQRQSFLNPQQGQIYQDAKQNQNTAQQRPINPQQQFVNQDPKVNQYGQQQPSANPVNGQNLNNQRILYQDSQISQSTAQNFPPSQGFRNVNQANNVAPNQANRQQVPLSGDTQTDNYFPTRNGFNQNTGNVALSPPPSSQPAQNYFGQNAGQNTQNLNVQPLLSSGDLVALANVDLNVKELSSSISNLGLHFMKNIGQSSQNLVFSPLSVASVLALLQLGAKGTTQAELTNALQLSPEAALTAFAKLNNNLQQRRSSRNTLELANNIFVADAFNLNIDYNRKAKSKFNSDVTPTFFTNNGETVNFINSWVAAKTHNRIKELVTPEDVNESTQVVIANAVFFKGAWQNKFKKEATSQKEFTLKTGQIRNIPFMRMRQGFQAGIDPTNQAQVIILPFDGKLYSLIVILPSDTSDASKVLPTLTEQKLLGYLNLPVREVLLEIPKFTTKTELDLAPILKKIGVKKVFTEDSDLSNMGTYQTFSPIVTSALHTAVLSIDEEGGTAAASSAFAAVALSFDENSMEFKVDKPFIAVLWDHKSAMPLFLAKIEDPSV